MAKFDLKLRLSLENMLKLPICDEACQQLGKDKKMLRIAEILKVHKSTICREIARNSSGIDSYDALIADKLATARSSKANTHFIYTEEQKQTVLDLFVEQSSEKSWSINAFLLRVKLDLPDIKQLPCMETVYQWVYDDAKVGGVIYKNTLRKHKKRKQQNHRKAKASKIDKLSIEERPETINERKRVGDFELDSVLSVGNEAGIITGTDRKSRYLVAEKTKSKHVEATNNAVKKMAAKCKFRSFTTDNGTEFAGLGTLAKANKINHYYAHPYSSWERGSNEHSNGMERRFYPKGTDFKKVSDEELQHSTYLINHMPRKIFNGLTAHEIYYGVKKNLIKKTMKNKLIVAFRTRI